MLRLGQESQSHAIGQVEASSPPRRIPEPALKAKRCTGNKQSGSRSCSVIENARVLTARRDDRWPESEDGSTNATATIAERHIDLSGPEEEDSELTIDDSIANQREVIGSDTTTAVCLKSCAINSH